MFVQLFHLCFWLKWLVVVAQVAPCFSLSLATPLHRIALVVKKQLRLTSGFLGFRCDHNWGLFWETDLFGKGRLRSAGTLRPAGRAVSLLNRGLCSRFAAQPRDEFSGRWRA